MMERSRIGLKMSGMELLTTMAEGNPGGLTVLMALMKRDKIMTIFDLDDMNMRGSQIWVAYKDVCGSDIDVLIAKCRNRETAMIMAVNSKCVEVATTRGNS